MAHQKYDAGGIKIFLALVKECKIPKMHFCAKNVVQETWNVIGNRIQAVFKCCNSNLLAFQNILQIRYNHWTYSLIILI